MKSFLTVNFGAGSLKVAEFEVTDTGSLRLVEYGLKPLGMEGSLESKREATLQKALQELLAERGFLARDVNICAPGFHVFSKFVKLPPVDTSKVTQIIQYEAQQNVPFPLDEVVWDYQITGTSATGELEVLLVAVKSDVVDSLFKVAGANGQRVQLVDASPAALCNAFRFNYGDQEGCAMLLDIGAKTSNVLLFENGKFYARGINIGANSITQDFATESKLRFAEAEEIKIAEGFVSLGGAYAEPDSKHQAAISKIARQVMTRLHIQVNQTIQFYRGQQGGSAPTKLYLCGGASVMPYTSEFFAEKLGVEVEYFNPLRNLELAPELDLEHLASVAHAFGEVVGAGLRNLAQCPVELNLMPEASLQKQQFDRKKPYLVAAAASLILVVGALGWFFNSSAAAKQEAAEEIQASVTPLDNLDRQLTAAIREGETAISKATQLLKYRGDQERWPIIFAELRKSFLQAEERFSTGGVSAGIWIENLSIGKAAEDVTILGQVQSTTTEDPEMAAADAARRSRFEEVYGRSYDPSPAAKEAAPVTTTDTVEPDPEGTVATIRMNVRAINLNGMSSDPTANTKLAFGLIETLKANPMFDSDSTRLVGEMEQADDTALSFGFEIVVKLSEPLEL